MIEINNFKIIEELGNLIRIRLGIIYLSILLFHIN